MKMFTPNKRSWLILIVLLGYALLPAQDRLIAAVENLKPNTISITTKFANGESSNGFGFITGEKDGKLYVVTAGHVLHNQEGLKSIQVQFYNGLKKYPAEEESWFETDDLSLLSLAKPAGLQWLTKFADFSPKGYEAVRFIGHNKDWVSPLAGEITKISNNRIDFIITTIQPGTSGAPLLTENGIIGLILEDEKAASNALSLTRIRELIGDNRYPYFSGSSYDPLLTPTSSTDQTDSYDLIPIKGGTFTMGCTSEMGSDCYGDEIPVTQVTVSDFALGKYEVTQAQWRKIMGSNPSNFSGCDQCPVEQVSWEDIQIFLSKLNAQTGKNYRLPTEAEWEFAARGGIKSAGYKYAGSNNAEEVAWYSDNAGSKTHEVGGKKPNELGLYDMGGNVWEWCQDWYGYYSGKNQYNPKGPNAPDAGSGRVIRGGSWYYPARNCHVSNRGNNGVAGRLNSIGFRLAR